MTSVKGAIGSIIRAFLGTLCTPFVVALAVVTKIAYFIPLLVQWHFGEEMGKDGSIGGHGELYEYDEDDVNGINFGWIDDVVRDM
ncbi:hypothetical protein CC80DRAFT_487162 [Byssothecium circinans]|uniref:Uncharacterized protein n=1 Tax=Byssothecium circinans TaxID=147558 RepID=A0A6A5UI90_9PLEO|nr:hypothetical protein CC80DRAFT_487162 [Byssothecium circinans]